MSVIGRTSAPGGRSPSAEITPPPHSPLLSVAGVALVLGAVVLVVAQQLAPSLPGAAPLQEITAAAAHPDRARAALLLAMAAHALLGGGALAVPFLAVGRRHAGVVVGALVWAVGGAASLASAAAHLTGVLVATAPGTPTTGAEAVLAAQRTDLLLGLDLVGTGLAVLGAAVTMVALVLARVVRPWVLVPVVVGALVLAVPDHGWLALVGTVVSLAPVVVLGLLLVRSRPLEQPIGPAGR